MTTENPIQPQTKPEPQAPALRSGDLFGVWVATADNPHPDKPGKKSYEIVPCLVVHKGEIEICAWNCEHGVWDDQDGDDFRYTTAQVSHWMPLPSLPSPNK